MIHADISVLNWRNIFKSNQIEHGFEFLSNHWSIPRNSKLGMQRWLIIFQKQIDRYLLTHPKPSVIHAHTYLGAWAAIKASKDHDIPLVVTEHFTGLLSGNISDLHDEIAKRAYKECNKIYAVSHALAQSVRGRYNVRVDVVPNFIDVTKFSLVKSIVETDVYRLLAVGDLIKRKSFDLLIEAMSLCSNVKLTLVGSGPEEKKLKNLRDKKCVEVEFVGQQNQSQLAHWYQNSDVLVHPSTTETFGLVLIEAIACGLPVVAFENGGASDIINESNGIIVKNRSVQNLAHAIQELIRNRKQFNQQSIRGTIINKYSPKVVAKRLKEEYAELLSD